MITVVSIEKAWACDDLRVVFSDDSVVYVRKDQYDAIFEAGSKEGGAITIDIFKQMSGL